MRLWLWFLFIFCSLFVFCGSKSNSKDGKDRQNTSTFKQSISFLGHLRGRWQKRTKSAIDRVFSHNSNASSDQSARPRQGKPKPKPKANRDRRRVRPTPPPSSSATSNPGGPPTRPGSHPPSSPPPVPSRSLSSTPPASDYLLSLVTSRPWNEDYEVQSTEGVKGTKSPVLRFEEDRIKYKEYTPSDKTLLSVLIQVLQDLGEPSALPVLVDVEEGRGYRTQVWVRRSVYTRPYAPPPLSTLPESFKPFIYWMNEKIWLAENPNYPGRPASDQLLSRVKALPKESVIPTEWNSNIVISGSGTDERRFTETLNPADGTLLKILRIALGLLEDSSGLPVLTNILEIPRTRWQDWIRRSAMNDPKARFPTLPIKELPESFKRLLSWMNEEIWRAKTEAASLRLNSMKKSPSLDDDLVQNDG